MIIDAFTGALAHEPMIRILFQGTMATMNRSLTMAYSLPEFMDTKLCGPEPFEW